MSADPASKYAVSSAPQEDNWTGLPEPEPPLEQLSKARSNNEEELGRLQFCCFSLCFPANAAVTIAMVVVGAIKLEQCQKEPLLPKFMIVHGCISFLLLLYTCIPRRRNKSSAIAKDKDKCCYNTLSCLFRLLLTATILFLLGWTLAFAYFVYKAWRPNFGGSAAGSESTPTASEDHCDLLLYSTAFTVVTAALSLLSLYPIFMCCCCCLCFFHYCSVANGRRKRRKRRERSRSIHQQGNRSDGAVAPTAAEEVAEEQV